MGAGTSYRFLGVFVCAVEAFSPSFVPFCVAAFCEDGRLTTKSGMYNESGNDREIEVEMVCVRLQL